MIERVRTYAPVQTDFHGGPSPRVPDSLFVPFMRPTVFPLSFTVNTRFGIGPMLHHYIPRQAHNQIVMQSRSRQTTQRPSVITVRAGAPYNIIQSINPINP